MSLTLKAFLYDKTWRGDPAEIRRFTVDQDVSSSYAYLVEKVIQVFPSLRQNNVTLAWTDSDGDLITISSDEELVQALDQFEGDLFRLYIKRSATSATYNPPKTVSTDESGDPPQEKCGPQSTTTDSPNEAQQDQNIFHPGVRCDGCNGSIYGTRFKCLMCHDYDLCSSCEGKGIHVDHNMITITEPHQRGFGCPRGYGFGPYRGGRGRCHGRGGQFGGFPHHHPGHGFHGVTPLWFPGFGMGGPGCYGGGGKCKPGEKAGKNTGEEPMDTEHKPETTEEERRTFLQGVGEAVSSFLQPFGVKVDVDVVGGEKKTDTDTSDTTSAEPEQSEVSNEVIDTALVHLGSMGYQDEGGWLRELVKSKGGDVAKVLDALHPNVEQD